MDNYLSEARNRRKVFSATKKGLIILTSAMFISGLIMFVYSLWSLIETRGFLTYGLYLTAMTIMFIVSLVLLTMALVGHCAMKRQSGPLLSTFMAFLALSFILIAISTGLAIIYRSRLGKTFRLQLVDSVKDYFEDEFTQDAWDSLQRGFKCCGLLAGDLDLYQRAPYMVWQHNEEFRKSSGPRVPESCCQPVGRPTGMTYGQFRRECQGNLRFVYLDDCYIKVEQFIRPRALVAAILGVTLALMALLGVTCAALYATTMRVQVNDLRARQLTKGRAFRTQQIAADAIKSERSATATRPQNGAILPNEPSAGATGPYRAEFYGRQNLASEETSQARRVPLVTLDPRMVPARQRSKMAPKKVYPKPPWQ